MSHVTNLAGGGGGVFANTFTTDSGTATPSGGVLNIIAGVSTFNCGSSVEFTGSGNTVELNVTDVDFNTIIGYQAGQNTTNIVSSNTLLGYQAGNTIGAFTTSNVAVGKQALFLCASSYNTALGTEALFNVTNNTCQRNVAVGNNSLTGLTAGLGFNVAIGDSTAGSLGTGTQNIVIGASAGNSWAGAESSNICIGNVGVLGDSNILRIGTPGSGAGQVNNCYIAGIVGTNLVSPLALVNIDSTGLLGVTTNVGASMIGTPRTTLNATGGVRWLAPFGTAATATQAQAEFVVPVKGTFSNLYVNLDSNGNTAVAGTFKVNRNGSNTTIVATATASTPGVYSDTVHSQLYNAGDTIQFEMSQATAGTSLGSISISFVAAIS
jgi:hypothetical protein